MTDVEEQLTRAYAGERFGLPSNALARLVRRRRRRLGYVAAAVAVFAAAGTGVLVDHLRALPEPALAGEFGVTAEAAACYRQTGGGSPEAAFTFTDPDSASGRLVVAVGDQHAVACAGGEVISLSPRDPGTGSAWLPGGELDFAYATSARHGLVVIGTTPPGTDRVEMTVVDGSPVAVELEGGWFAAWQPIPDRPYTRVRVVARTATTSHIEEVETATG